jgi:tRNA pseudouridine38-40 synthase
MARRNFLLRLAYNGRDFQGWQRLPGKGRSVQGTVEDALGRALGAAPGRSAPGGPSPTPIEVVGAGRTDAGVHAEGQAASFHAFTPLTCEAIREALNAAFPPDLSCRGCVEVDPRFHARLHASSKLYRYRILNRPDPDPALRDFSLHVPERLDLAAMAEAGRRLLGERDFRALSNARGEDTVRRLDEVRFVASSETGIVDLLFVGPGFLYNQARIMAAFILEAGKGRMDEGRMKAILEDRDRRAAPGALGPFGLCLVEVRYDRLDRGGRDGPRRARSGT